MPTDLELQQEIIESRRQFDLANPLTNEELTAYGMLAVLPSAKDPSSPAGPVARELEEDSFAPVDAVGALVAGESYNARYAHYLRCQAIVTLVAFEEGWKALEELVLQAYVRARRSDNANYRGDDPNKGFALRLKQVAAEDFVLFIRTMVAEAAAVPRPVLEKEM